MSKENADITLTESDVNAMARLNRELDRDKALCRQAGEDVKDLLASNLSAMKRIMLDEGKETMSVAIKLDFQDEPGGWTLKTGITYARKYKDERETHIDTEQTKINFDEEEEEQ